MIEPGRCAHCGLRVAAWRVDVRDVVYCTAYCARLVTGQPEATGEARAAPAPTSPR